MSKRRGGASAPTGKQETRRRSDHTLKPARPVIFHRVEGWYPLILPIDDDLNAHAECNPGTLMITDGLTGEVLWRLQ